MSSSRRKFLKLSTLATLVAVFPFRGNAFVVSGEDPLANYTKATFKSYLRSVFQLYAGGGIVEVTLTTVGDMPSPPGGECFTLLFRGGARSYTQNTYTLSHPALGKFGLFLVPVGADKYGAQGYLATINRLSPYDAATIAPPTK
jgi:hypothetical protein